MLSLFFVRLLNYDLTMHPSKNVETSVAYDMCFFVRTAAESEARLLFSFLWLFYVKMAGIELTLMIWRYLVEKKVVFIFFNN